MNWEHESEHSLKLSNGNEVLVRENWKGEGKIARDYLSENAAKVEIRERRNGSGPNSFGGAERWPHVEVGVSLQEGERDKAVALATLLVRAIDEFFKANP